MKPEPNNKVVIERDKQGKIVEIKLLTREAAPDRKTAVMELVALTTAIFGGVSED